MRPAGHALTLAAILTLAPFVARGQAAPSTQPSAQHLIAALSSQDPAARINAARQLAERREAVAVPDLSRVLGGDPVEEVRGWAARALAAMGTAEAQAAVIQASRSDPSQRVRELAARLTGQPAPQPPPPASVAPAPQPPPPTSIAPAPQPAAAPVAVVVPAQTPPPRRRSRAGLVLTIVGWSTFGAAYLASTIIGATLVSANADFGWSWFIPVAGPAIYGSHLISTASDAGLAAFLVGFLGILCWVPALVEAAGVIVAAVGHGRLARDAAEAQASAPSGLQLAIVPSGPRGLPGLSLAGQF